MKSNLKLFFIVILIFLVLFLICFNKSSNKKDCISSDISLANKYIPTYEIKPLKKNTSYFLKKLLEKLEVVGAVGIPGTSTLYFYQQIVRDPKWNVILARQENNAGFIANGSFRASRYTKRKFYLAFASTGPGSSNFCTPIADSMCDYVPSLYITNDLADYNLINPIDLHRNRKIQDVDPEDIFGSLCKVIVRITKENAKSGKFIEEIVNGYRKSFTFPQGPLVIVIGENTANIEQTDEIKNMIKQNIDNIPNMFKSDIGLELKDEYRIYSESKIIGFKDPYQYDIMMKNFHQKYLKSVIPNENIFDFLNFSLKDSKKPLIIIGNGCIDIMNDLYKWIHTYNIPYLTTLPLQGFVNKYDPICARRMGHSATYTGNYTVYNSDWILCLGISFNGYQFISDKKEDICPNAKYLISWNIFPELTNVPYVTNYIVDNVKNVLTWKPSSKTSEEWISQIKEFKTKDFALENSTFYKDSSILQYGTMISIIQKFSDDFIKNNPYRNVWFVTDVGMTQVVSANLFVFKNITNYKLITSAKFATVGSGLGLAIGVALSNPEDLVVLVAGDLGIQMSLPDWITVKEAKVKNLAIFVAENSGFNLVETENEQLDLTPIPDANGYAQTIDWLRMIEGVLLPCYIWKDNNKSNHVYRLLKDTLFKDSFFCVCVVEDDVMSSPMVPLNGPITDLRYSPGGKAKEFNKIRGELIAHV